MLLCLRVEVKLIFGRRFWLSLLIGASAGLFGGLMGVGGGVVIVPMLAAFLGLTQHQAHGTSLAIVFPIGCFGAIPYALQGHVDWAAVALLSAGSVLGVVLGARWMAKVPARRLRQGFGLFLLVVGLRLLIWGV